MARSISQHISARLVHIVEEGEVQLRTVSDVTDEAHALDPIPHNTASDIK